MGGCSAPFSKTCTSGGNTNHLWRERVQPWRSIFSQSGLSNEPPAIARMPGKASAVQVVGLLAHEATHVWQHVRDWMGEKSPSVEFEAYTVQAILQELLWAYNETRPHRIVLGRAR